MGKIKQWESEKIKRSDIKFAEYNPRKIKDKNQKKLQENLEKKGLMGGIVWNKRTGNLVSGHQRIKLLDKDNKKKDYDVICTVVDIDETDEMAQNIFFNNAEAQGEFVDDSLQDILKQLDYTEDTGFDKNDVLQTFGVTRELSKEEYEELAQNAENMKQVFNNMKKFQKGGDSDDFYTVLVFKESKERDIFLESIGLEPNKFQNAQMFINALTKKARGE